MLLNGCNFRWIEIANIPDPSVLATVRKIGGHRRSRIRKTVETVDSLRKRWKENGSIAVFRPCRLGLCLVVPWSVGVLVYIYVAIRNSPTF